MTPIVTLTLNPAVDKNSTVEQVVPERKLRCGPPEHHPGGGGINVARAITALGGSATAYWTRGGAIGDLLEQSLDREGIIHHPIAIKSMTRENLVVFENSSGQQFRFGMPGAPLTEEEVQACLARLSAINPAPEYLVLSGSLPPGVVGSLYTHIARAMPASTRVVLDTSGPPLQLGLESPVYLIKPNVHELEQLAGRSVEHDSQIREVARSLIDDGRVQVVVTSLGSAGVALTTADEFLQIRAPTVKIRSKVGAGDSMVAGIVLALSRGKSIVDAVHFGVAAGSAAVMTEGTELCRREDTQRLYQEMTRTRGQQTS